MKRIFTIAAIAAATILAASCAKEEKDDPKNEGIIAHASLQPVETTKAIGEYSYNIVWEENDKIAVLDNTNNKASFTLKEGAGSTTGTFQQEGTDALTAPLTAYYPASVVADDKSLVWPAIQADVKDITNVPMTAESSTADGDVNFAFKHLGSVLQLVLTAKNGTVDVKQIDITADQGLSGAFSVENGAAVLTSTGTTITTGDISDKNIKLTPTASYLNFAIPAGDFTNFTITITDIDDKTYSLSSASLTLERAMVNKVTFAMDADNASYELKVNGHTVIVKLHKGTPASEVLVNTSLDKSGNVVIKTSNEAARELICMLDDNRSVVPVRNGQYFTFTIPDITNDITAILCYKYVLKPFVYPSCAGTISTNKTDPDPGDEITLEVTSSGKLGDGGKFVGWKDKDGNLISDQASLNFVMESDMFPVAVFDVNYGADAPLSGVFTVAADKGNGDPKTVRFSKGNLWYGKTNEEAASETFNFEENQWDFQIASGNNWDPEHISYFMWSKDADVTYQLAYSDPEASGSDGFFTNSTDFAINGVSAWHTLSKDEWKYLLGNSGERKGKYKAGVTVNGKMGLVIAPDRFEGTISDAYTDLDWATAESQDGLVFLPAAGFRTGGNTAISFLSPNPYGYYWSASPSPTSSSGAYDMFFYGSSVSPSTDTQRSRAQSVRLVTDCR